MTRARLAPSAIDILPAALASAANTYAAAFEAVAAGGAVIPSANAFSCAERGGSAAPSKEGRQSNAVDQVTFLRRLVAAVGPSAIVVAPRSGRTVAVRDLWEGVTVEGLSMARYLQSRGLARDAGRQRILREALIACAERVADAIGAERSPFDA